MVMARILAHAERIDVLTEPSWARDQHAALEAVLNAVVAVLNVEACFLP